MADLTEIFQSLIADHLKASRKQIEDLSIIASFYYSNQLFEDMSEFLRAEELETLQKSNIRIGLDDLDCIFIYSFEWLGQKHLAVIYDYCELFFNTVVWDIFSA